MSDEKIIAKLKKIMALADGGVGGEKETAERMLQSALKRHGISRDELIGDKISTHWFKIEYHHRRLAFQLAYKVIGHRNYGVWSNKAKRGKTGLDMTDAQAVEFEVSLEIYAKALDKHRELSYRAFIQANDLFGDPDPNEEAPKWTEEDDKIARMAAGLDAVEVQQRIGKENV